MWRDILLDNRTEVLPLIEALAAACRSCAQRSRRATRAHRKAACRGQGRTRSFHRGVTGDGRGRTLDVRAPRSGAGAGRVRVRETSAGAVRARGPRSSADDSELWNLIPGDSDAVADVDLAALRASPWSRSLMEGSLDGEREERRQRFGYDVFTEAERMLVAGAEAAGGTNTLTIARGRFDAARVASAFPGRHPGRGRDAVAGQLAVGGAGAGGRAGHAAYDRAGRRPARAGVDRRGVGVVADAGGGPLGEIRRALDADKNPPAVTIAISVTDGMRARAAGMFSLPDGLRRVGARLNLGDDLDVDGLALFDSAGHAATAASIWNDAARLYAKQQMVVLLGLAPVFEGLALEREGPRVHVRLHIGADRREGLADKLLAVLQALAKNRK
jgi:hypothetical protein